MKQSILHRSLVSVLLALMAFCAHASFKYVDTDTGLKFEMYTGLSGGSDAARRAMLVGFGGKSGDVTIPENVVYSHLDWKVVAIKSAQEGGNVTSVVIPDTVRSMDAEAFASCSELSDVVIGAGLTKIPKGAFQSCGNIRSVKFGANVKSIGEAAFYGCEGLTEVELPEGLTHIGKSAFQDCTSLVRVKVPSTLKVIEKDAFRGCAALETVTGDCDLESCAAAFDGTPFTARDPESEFRFVQVGACVVGYKGPLATEVMVTETLPSRIYERLGELVIPNGVTTIADCAFSQIGNVENGPDAPLHYDLRFPSQEGIGRLVLPHGLRSIGSKAFLHCGWMKEVTGGWDVASVGDAAFYGTMYSGQGYSDWSLCEYEGIVTYMTFRQVVLGSVLVAVKGPWPSAVVIPNGVKRISPNVFYCGSGYRDGVDKREAGREYWRGFNYEYGLPDRPYTTRFRYDDQWQRFVEDSKIDTSEWMTSLTLPGSLERLDEDAFTGGAVKNLSDLAGGENLHDVARYPFVGTPLHESLRQKGGFLRLGDTICGWAGDCPETLTIPEGVAVIADGAFSNWDVYDGDFSTLKHVVFPSTLRRIGKSAFAKQKSLESPEIPDGVEFVGGQAFADCTSMTELTLPSTVKAIGNSIVHGHYLVSDPSVVNVTFLGNAPELVDDDDTDQLIGYYPLSMLQYTQPRHTVTFGENTTGWFVEGDDMVPEEWYGWDVRPVMGGWAFDECSTSIGASVASAVEVRPIMSIPPEFASYGEVVEIGSRVFGAKAAKLEELTIPGWVGKIARDAFVGCTGLRFVYVEPFRVEIVRTALEQSGLDLGKVTVFGLYWDASESDFGDGLDVWGVSGDVGSELVIPSMIDGRPVVSVSLSADSGVVSVKVPDSVVVLGPYAFAWSEDLKQVTLGSGVQQIEDSAFNGAAALETIDVSSENPVFRSEDGCVLSKDGTVLHKCPAGKTTLTLRAKLTEIASGAFESAYPHIITCVEAGAAQIELIRTALDEAYYGDVEDIAFIVLEDVGPTIEGDEGATVTGDAETGFVVKPSEGKTSVEVTIPQGVDAAKVTVEVSPKVASVKPNGATVKIVSGGADVTEFLNVPAADGDGVVDLTKATVKEEIVKEAMDVEKGAEIKLNAANPTLTTPNTRKGLFYQLREGATLDGMKNGDSKVGDGQPWSPEITVKGGNSAFYSIGVGKGE